MVDDAMRSMNFSKLNQDIGRTVNQALEEARRQFGGYRDTDFLPHVDPHSKYDRADQSKWQQNMGGQKRTYERTTQKAQTELMEAQHGQEAQSRHMGERSMQVVLVKVSRQRRMRRGFSQLGKYLGFC